VKFGTQYVVKKEHKLVFCISALTNLFATKYLSTRQCLNQ